jgi:diguanylate cyclase (GGDEF)-like protein
MDRPMNCSLANESPQARWLERLDTATRPVDLAAMIVELAEEYAECASARVLWEPDAGNERGSASSDGWLHEVAVSGMPRRVVALGEVAFRLCQQPRPILLLLALHPGCDAGALMTELDPLLQLAGRRLGILLGWFEQRRSPPPLEYSERLHRALFAIADLAGCSRDVALILRDIHAVLRSLMLVESFCVVACAPGRDVVRFACCADGGGALPLPGGGQDMPLASIESTLLWYLLKDGKAVLGPPAQLRKQVSGPLVLGGSDRAEWMGVPMLRDGMVCGALVVQAEQPDSGYSNEELVLLEFVASHVLYVLERSAPERDAERRALAKANRALQRRVASRGKALHEEAAARMQAQHQLGRALRLDALTGLANQQGLHERIERALGVLQHDSHRRCALLQLNLDRFGSINEALGHGAGDEVLQQVAARLSCCIRAARADLVARLAADEFAVLLVGVKSVRQVMQVAGRILGRLAEPLRVGERELQVSARIGIVICDAGYRSVEQVRHDADIALRRAGQPGQRRMALFAPAMVTNAVDVLAMEGELRQALRNDEFEPYFQPIRRLDDGRVVGCEALIRWNHPTRGVLAPAGFLKVARDCQLIEAIDWRMFELSLRAFAQCAPAGVFLTLNVSALHLGHADFDVRLLALLEHVGVAASRVIVEVTEEMLLEHPDDAHAMLARLRGAGVGAALDDFGTGYSSLHYLQALPLHVLKVDRVFVEGLDKAADGSAAIVAAIIALARALDIQVIAEGIETPTQRSALAAMGCVMGQGYLLGRPTAAANGLPA